MSVTNLKAYLYHLTSELNRLNTTRKNLLELHSISTPEEVRIELAELDKLIKAKEAEIKSIL
jgi:hypothetical protein